MRTFILKQLQKDDDVMNIWQKKKIECEVLFTYPYFSWEGKMNTQTNRSDNILSNSMYVINT